MEITEYHHVGGDAGHLGHCKQKYRNMEKVKMETRDGDRIDMGQWILLFLEDHDGLYTFWKGCQK